MLLLRIRNMQNAIISIRANCCLYTCLRFTLLRIQQGAQQVTYISQIYLWIYLKWVFDGRPYYRLSIASTLFAHQTRLSSTSKSDHTYQSIQSEVKSTASTCAGVCWPLCNLKAGISFCVEDWIKPPICEQKTGIWKAWYMRDKGKGDGPACNKWQNEIKNLHVHDYVWESSLSLGR